MFIVVGLAFAWGATTYSFGSSARPGPGYFPFGLGIMLAILGAILLRGLHHQLLVEQVRSDVGGRRGEAIVLRELLVVRYQRRDGVVGRQ